MSTTSGEYNFLTAKHKIDRKLYKYFSDINKAIDCIQKRAIHLDDPQKFNDPFEAYYCCYFYTIHSTTDKKSNIIAKIHSYIAKAAILNQQLYKDMMNAMMAYMVKSFVSDERICESTSVIREVYAALGDVNFTFDSFCEAIDLGFRETNPFIPIDCKMSCFSEIHDSILMWSYYANSHKGICIEYDLSKLPQNPTNQLIVNALTKVQYSPNRIDCLHGDAEDNVVNILTSKSDVWSHEQEWRIVCETNNEWLPFDCISGVYLGKKFNLKSPLYKKLVDSLEEKQGLKIYKAKLHTTKYQLEFSEEVDIDFYRTFKSQLGQK
jgi:hypothetical protein